ncbi:lysM domain-containing GPI-anchored protein 1-like [Impatiens glandulifera]|uniref:lysM domain-containing GPI-anchored protein 1-like n=1 Tax=Impatiens glandulifera TaxID=253017 RepID=UPI001FB0A4D8|nr:lysM domain-containing GPI-anchored protein 1-like [Impatiens glandulifera]
MKTNQSLISISFIFFTLLISNLVIVTSKSTIEPCSNSDTCNALAGYTLYTDLKVSEVAALFQIDPIALLTANSIDISYPDVENHILPSQLFLKVPIQCSCVDGIRKSVTTRYKTRPSDTLAIIADSIYGGLVSADQLKEANTISDPSILDVGQTLTVPLPCTCFNGTDNFLPAIYMSYVVIPMDTLAGIAARYSTTITDLMTVNALGGTSIDDGDILSIPLSACASSFPRYASDFGLMVPNGSYAIIASHCVQCSCALGSRNLYCMPSTLAVSCSSMQCRNSNLMLGNVTWQQSAAGCNVTSCSYSGYVNGSIATTLSTSLQPRCPGPQQFPALIAPPSTIEHQFPPAEAPSPTGGAGLVPNSPSTVPSSGFLPGLSPMNSPNGGQAGAGSKNKPLLAGFFPVAIAFAILVWSSI